MVQFRTAHGVKPTLRRCLGVASALLLAMAVPGPTGAQAVTASSATPVTSSISATSAGGVATVAPASSGPGEPSAATTSGGLAAKSASQDPPDPHTFLDDSSTGPISGGVQPSATGTPTLAAGFNSSVVIAGLDHPTAVRFASDGSVWVIQKSGQILRYSSLSATTPTLIVFNYLGVTASAPRSMPTGTVA